MKILWHISLLILLIESSYAQDPQLSQYYAAPLYLNPAFTGNTVQSRLILNYRNQWAAIPGAFISYAFSYDHNLQEINSGAGFMAIHDKAGSGALRFTNLAGFYSYSAQLNRKLVLKPGVSLSYTLRNINFSDLTFGDQLVRGGNGVTTSEHPIEPVQYMDAAAGLLLYSEKFWLGTAFHHLNKPNQSLVGGLTRLPLKGSVHGGYNISIKQDITKKRTTTLTLTAVYKAQEKWDQLDLGCYVNISPIVLGLWYRGIPVLKAYQPGYGNNDAAIIMFGYELNTFKIGYSYDITISRLISNTAGSHEISIAYEFASPRHQRIRNRKKFYVPCAKF